MNPNLISPYIRQAVFTSAPAPFAVSERSLLDYELIWVISGRCKLLIGGREYICKKDEAVLIPPDRPHAVSSIENIRFVGLSVHFDLSYSPRSEKRFVSYKNKTEMTDEERALIQKDALKKYALPYVFTPIDGTLFQNLVFDVIDLYRSTPYGYVLKAKAKMTEILSLILEQFVPHSAVSSKTASAVRSVKNYVDNNFHKILTLDDLASQFFINKFTLLRNFKKIYKTNVMTYYKEKRLEYAKNMLVSTRLTVSEIADCLSFGDVYTFSRLFKTQTTVAPSIYRGKFHKN